MTAAEHPEWVALRRAITAAPDDDTPRLVAADWLDEAGDPGRAAFIRVQVELAHLEGRGLGRSAEADHLRLKEKVLGGPLSIEASLWAAADCPELVTMRPGSLRVEGADRLSYRRGFVEAVRCAAREWLHHGRAIRERQPVRLLALTGCCDLPRDRWAAMTPALSGLRRVILDNDPNRLVEWLRDRLPDTDLSALPPR